MQPIWFRTVSLAELRSLSRNTLVDSLGIEFVEIGPDFLSGTMPVDHRTHQPMGILHGGASVALAETLGSLAAYMALDASKFHGVGMEINANHLRPVSDGKVLGRAAPLHLGRRSQVWQIDIRDVRERLVCVARLTLAVVEGPVQAPQPAF